MISLSILFANDDVLTQWVMTEVLTEAGFDVVSACRGQQVLELLSDTPEFDLLLVDLAMSDVVDEHQIACHWRQALPGRPIVYTGPDRSRLRRPLSLSESFLRTPFNAGVLLRTVDAALEDACFRTMRPEVPSRMQHVH